MSQPTLDDLRYPVGRFHPDPAPDPGRRASYIDLVAALPGAIEAAVAGLSDDQLDTPYREGGWTLRQVVHHLADSHLNAYVRFKLALTEDNPEIRAYDEAAWARLADGADAPLEVSLALLRGLHARWTMMLRSMSPADFGRTLRHPVSGTQTLDRMLSLYAWHGRHHVAHVTSTRSRNAW